MDYGSELRAGYTGFRINAAKMAYGIRSLDQAIILVLGYGDIGARPRKYRGADSEYQQAPSAGARASIELG